MNWDRSASPTNDRRRHHRTAPITSSLARPCGEALHREWEAVRGTTLGKPPLTIAGPPSRVT